MMTAPITEERPGRRVETPRKQLFNENVAERKEIVNILIEIANSIINVAEILRVGEAGSNATDDVTSG